MTLAVAGPAWAQAQPQAGRFAVDRFEPAGAGSEWFTLESLDLRGHLRFGANLTGEWASHPLVIFDQSGNEVAPLVRNQVVAHAGVGLVLWDRARLDASFPVVPFQSGAGGIVAGQSYAAAGRAAIGDLRLGLDLRLFGRAHDEFTAAVGVQVFTATGNADAYTSDGRTRYWPRLSLAGEHGVFVWAARVGYQLRSSAALAPGDEVTGGLAVGWRVWPTVLLGPELTASSRRSGFGKAITTPAELLFGGHVAVAPDWQIGVGVGPGLTDGAGSPTVRVLASVAYWPAIVERAPVRPLPVARAPERPRPAPAARRPVAPPPPPPPPPDTDGDGILDSEDACPSEAGVASEDPQKNGCPAPKDRDGDGIVDTEDACPDAAGPTNTDAARNGCPVVRIEGGQIRIREQIQFKTASASIRKQSNYILEAVVKVLREHDDITKVRIEGHTDTRGKPAANKSLSKRRAAAVVKWLVKHGIKKGRLTSEGYGQERPIATNLTDDGRQQNRRVEFHIVEGPGAEP
ncbi:MAG TPA: OmpA family protein [Polyangia bacterium]|nr:OmpA family protein [Polyangia bacterium]